MTASSELRAAATKLRATAKGTARFRTPWHARPGFNESGLVATANHHLVADCAEPLVAGTPHWGGLPLAEWIALVDPRTAEPLACALDLVADFWDTLDPHLDASHQHDDTAVGHHLLVIARQINGCGS